jgi:hypothetical protein
MVKKEVLCKVFNKILFYKYADIKRNMIICKKNTAKIWRFNKK